eukprot:564526-Amphidinium_carterae.1
MQKPATTADTDNCGLAILAEILEGLRLASLVLIGHVPQHQQQSSTSPRSYGPRDTLVSS